MGNQSVALSHVLELLLAKPLIKQVRRYESVAHYQDW